MILTVHSDVAYLVAAKARSRAAGYHFFGNKDGKLFNGLIFVLAKIIKM
jgi:sulfur transfer protein SufE